jgi:hypothetical protein
MSSIDFLVKLRDAAHMIQDACEEYLEKLAPPQTKQAVNEATFNVLKFESQTGAKIGEYEVAYKANNPPDEWQVGIDKWTYAYNVLRTSKATIDSAIMEKATFSLTGYSEKTRAIVSD